MRSIGTASRALELMLMRVTDPVRVTFGKALHEHGTIIAGIAQSRMEIDQARLLVLSAALQVRSCAFVALEPKLTFLFAEQIDLVRAKGAMKEIGMAKVGSLGHPRILLHVADSSSLTGYRSPCRRRGHRPRYAGSRSRGYLPCVQLHVVRPFPR